MKKALHQGKTSQEHLIVSLIESLPSKSSAVREKSRKQLVDIGHAAVIPLLHSLKDPIEHVRWEAAKRWTRSATRLRPTLW